MDEERSRHPNEVEYGELPELTRALRALGSTRRGGSSQSLLFHPLLEARRRAADARTAEGRVNAFDATDLARALDRAVDRIVAEWPDNRPSAKRALKAELVERVRGYAHALSLLSERAAQIADAEPERRLDAWRGWTTQLAAVFDAADRCWISLRSVVDVLPRS